MSTCVSRAGALLPLVAKDFDSDPGSIPIEMIMETMNGTSRAAAKALAIYFCERIPRVILLVFVLVSAAIDDESDFKFKWLWY